MGKVNEPERGVDTIYGFPIQQIFLAAATAAATVQMGRGVRKREWRRLRVVDSIAFNVRSGDFYCDGDSLQNCVQSRKFGQTTLPTPINTTIIIIESMAQCVRVWLRLAIDDGLSLVLNHEFWNVSFSQDCSWVEVWVSEICSFRLCQTSVSLMTRQHRQLPLYRCPTPNPIAKNSSNSHIFTRKPNFISQFCDRRAKIHFSKCIDKSKNSNGIPILSIFLLRFIRHRFVLFWIIHFIDKVLLLRVCVCGAHCVPNRQFYYSICVKSFGRMRFASQAFRIVNDSTYTPFSISSLRCDVIVQSMLGWPFLFFLQHPFHSIPAIYNSIVRFWMVFYSGGIDWLKIGKLGK